MKIQYQNDHLIIFESALYRTTTTLIFDDNHILLVDPNWLPIEIEFIVAWVDQNTQAKEKYLLFTHSDYDHIISYSRFKNYKTIASKAFTENPDVASILKQINDFDDENYISRDYPIIYPFIDKPISGDPESVRIGNSDYIFHQAAGHNRDGIICYNQSKGILIVGDYLSNIEFPYIYESITRYKQTLNKLEQIINNQSVHILITGHGDYTTTLGEMKQRISESRNYITQLEYAVMNDQSFDLEQLFKRYKFPKIMTKFHEGNMKLVKDELKSL